MRQIRTFSDSRLDSQCAFCGSFPENRDHVPSKILLDKPYPENLPVVPSCIECNNGFSLDEVYFACSLECIICGTTEVEGLKRESIKKTLSYNKKLHKYLKESFTINGGEKQLKIDEKRFKNVILKCAFGHLKYECSETEFRSPESIWYSPVHMLDENQQRKFFAVLEVEKAPEIGSRAMHRLFLNEEGVPHLSWINVQEGVYCYFVAITMGVKIVRMLIRNYLACEVVWPES